MPSQTLMTDMPMHLAVDVLVAVYLACTGLLVVYGVNCHVLTVLFLRGLARLRRRDAAVLERFYGLDGGPEGPPDGELPEALAERLPRITTQLPIYNERAVALRVVRAAAAMRYPAGKHEIQVLDDSTDETRELLAAEVARLRAQGVAIRHITRERRTGFKAGALREGLAQARGELVAIFDADFAPPPDFLLRAAPHFLEDTGLALVQGRWEHENRERNLLTRLQAIGIDGHFMVEQTARDAAGLFFNFNGTAGVLRAEAIHAAGGWQDDTLTEDLDLSYRMQLAGWRCRYVVDLTAPAEIPARINAFKSQQHRWAKGSIQTLRKLAGPLLRSEARPWAKVQAVLHLSHYLVHPLMLAVCLLAVPLLAVADWRVPGWLFGVLAGLLAVSFLGPSTLYAVSQRALGRSALRTLACMPLLAALGCGLAVNNTRAVLAGLFGPVGEFVRTPKEGLGKAAVARAPRKASGAGLELAAGLWCLAGVAAYLHSAHWLIGPFLFIYAVGFTGVGTMSWLAARPSSRIVHRPLPRRVPRSRPASRRRRA